MAKSARKSEKPRQAWGLTGLIEMQRECLCKFLWWSWRDLNPRPQIFFERIYMFSGLIEVLPPVSHSHTLYRTPVPYGLALSQGTRFKASRCV
jgi:hypothetical protein